MFVQLASSLIIFSLLITTLSTRYRKHLRCIPGPFVASFSNLWKVHTVHRGDMPARNIALHERYGPVVRIGPNDVSFASPEALKAIYTARPTFAKARIYTMPRTLLSLLHIIGSYLGIL